jgi:hypothetical protein
MTTDQSSAKSALNRIEEMFGEKSSRTSPAGAAPKYPEPPVNTIQPFPRPADPSQRQQQEQSALIYYSSRVPPISPSLLFDMEAHFPGLVAFLASLQSRPAVQEQLMTNIDAMKRRSQTSERSDEHQQRLYDLGLMIAQDAFGDVLGPRKWLAAAGVAIGAAALTFTIVHSWRHQ